MIRIKIKRQISSCININFARHIFVTQREVFVILRIGRVSSRTLTVSHERKKKMLLIWHLFDMLRNNFCIANKTPEVLFSHENFLFWFVGLSKHTTKFVLADNFYGDVNDISFGSFAQNMIINLSIRYILINWFATWLNCILLIIQRQRIEIFFIELLINNCHWL